MQIPPVPATTPVVTADTAARVAATVQSQAVKPLLQRAVDPTSKSGNSHKSRSNGDKSKGDPHSDSNQEHSVNIRV